MLVLVWVAPLTGSVDRNYHKGRCCVNPCVAPLTGSVDINESFEPYRPYMVAPLTGSVDRNGLSRLPSAGPPCRSPHGERG